jgi:hypothetical protein
VRAARVALLAVPFVRVFLFDFAELLLATFDLVALEEEPLDDAGLASFCAVLPGAASTKMGASAITTHRVPASQRVPIESGLERAGVCEAGLGENATFIYPLYDDFTGHWQARTTTVNEDTQLARCMAWLPAPLSGKLSL